MVWAVYHVTQCRLVCLPSFQTVSNAYMGVNEAH